RAVGLDRDAHQQPAPGGTAGAAVEEVTAIGAKSHGVDSNVTTHRAVLRVPRTGLLGPAEQGVIRPDAPVAGAIELPDHPELEIGDVHVAARIDRDVVGEAERDAGSTRHERAYRSSLWVDPVDTG